MTKVYTLLSTFV